MKKLYFENIDQAYRMLRKAIRHNAHQLESFCQWVIECMEWDQRTLVNAR